MKIIAIGDIHGRPIWKKIVEQEADANLFVFVGDYFDSFDIPGEDQIRNFLDIMKFSEANEGKVVTLIGNHDHHYFNDIGNTGTSGYQADKCFMIGHVLQQYRQRLQMAYQHENVLFTHAGLSIVWLNNILGENWKLEEGQTYADTINEIWKHKPAAFIFHGRDPYGNDKYQTPIWIRPQALMYVGRALKRYIIQVVGHTGQNKIDIQGKATGGRYYFIDTLGTSGEYLVIENNTFTSKTVKEDES